MKQLDFEPEDAQSEHQVTPYQLHAYFGYELFLPIPVTLQRGLEHPRL